ncbi:serine/threonine protein kinase, CMGC [Basidiobolus ranarum]|uniref:non-specific serine/threonine protein kinase n=1 Tax=Basidiobolus ranarum TaxID=34480 RepID=A0ABR2X065_9FUNG
MSAQAIVSAKRLAASQRSRIQNIAPLVIASGQNTPLMQRQYIDNPIPAPAMASEILPEGEEDPADYRPGGYHPVHVGEQYNAGRYTVIRKLGWGHFSTVWLAKDHNYDRHVALKVVKSAPHYTDTAIDEIKLLERVYSANPDSPGRLYIVELLDHFQHSGPNGIHICMVFEVLGENLLSLIKKYNHRGVPSNIVKEISKQVLLGLDYLHRECGIIHTDLKPENILICVNNIEDFIAKEFGDLEDDVVPIGKSRSRHIRRLTSDQPIAPRFGNSSKSKSRPPPSPLSPIHSFRHVILNDDDDDDDDDVPIGKSRSRRLRQPSIDDNDDLPLISATSKSMSRPPLSPANPIEYQMNLRHLLNNPPNPSNDEVDEDDEKLVDVLIKHQMSEYKTNESGGLSVSPQEISLAVNKVAQNISELSLNNSDNLSMSPSRLPTYSTPRIAQEPVIRVKIADLGNACWVDKHFTNDIQTRQYRSPEVIIGSQWGTSADMWSLACMIFELRTGDYLFDPQSTSRYTKSDDHLAQAIELLGNLPKPLLATGKLAEEYFNSRGELKRIQKLRHWSLPNVLNEKYLLPRSEAELFADFLLPMLDLSPEKRGTAEMMLRHSWLHIGYEPMLQTDSHIARRLSSRRPPQRQLTDELSSSYPIKPSIPNIG